MKYNAAPTACETFAYGEVEDYTVNITASAPSTDFEGIAKENTDVFTFFPNPVKEVLTVKLKGTEEKTTIRIVDIRGVVMKQVVVNSLSNEIDVAKLPKGVYVISIDGLSRQEKKQFIKM